MSRGAQRDYRMAAVSHDLTWNFGLVQQPGTIYKSPLSQRLLYPYQLQQVNVSSEGGGGGGGDYQVSPRELITSPHSCYEVLELLGE